MQPSKIDSVTMMLPIQRWSERRLRLLLRFRGRRFVSGVAQFQFRFQGSTKIAQIGQRFSPSGQRSFQSNLLPQIKVSVT